MKEKFKKVRDRKLFFNLVSKHTGCDIQNVSTNWFSRAYLAVPKTWIEWTDTFLDKFLEYEKEYQKASKTLHEKYFGN
jgi:DNA-dependent RNA polymerase auxiliary subunit epsilon